MTFVIVLMPHSNTVLTYFRSAIAGGNSDISVLLGDGIGSFGGFKYLKAGLSPTDVVVGDFNKDGKPDLATVNNRSDDISVLLNTTTTNVGFAGDSNATLIGSSIGRDTLIGSNSDDILVGDISNDTLAGSAGNDQVLSESSKAFGDITTDDSTNNVNNLNQILASPSYDSSLLIDAYVQPAQIGSNTIIQADPNSDLAPDIFKTLVTV